MEKVHITRNFKYKKIILQDPNPELMPELVMEHYANLYPELTNGQVISRGLQANGTQLFEFQTIIAKLG